MSASGMAAAPAPVLRHPGRLPPPFSRAQRNAVHAVSRCPRSQGLLNVVAAARKAAAAADTADTVATSTAAGADDAPAPKKRGRPRKAAQSVQDPPPAEASAAPKPRGRKKKDTAAEGNGAQPAPEAKQKAPRKKKEALEDGAVRNLKLKFDKDEAEQQMVRRTQLSSGIDGVTACAEQ